MGEIVYKVEEIINYYTSSQEERIIGYATGNPEDIAEFFRARSQEMITVSPLEIIAVTSDKAKDVRQATRQLQEAKEKIERITKPKTCR